MLNLGGVKESSMEKNHTNIPPWPFFSGFIQTSKRKQLRQIHEGTTQTILPSAISLTLTLQTQPHTSTLFHE